MPKFESTLGSKQFSHPNMREINISDESGYEHINHNVPSSRQLDQNFQMDDHSMREFQSRMQPQENIEEEIRRVQEAKKARISGKERLSEGAKRRIEMLIEMTKLSRTVEVNGQTYILQALTSKELRDAMVAAAEFSNTVEFAFETVKQVLSRSLSQIAGVPIDNFLNSSSLEDRLNFVECLDHALANRLYDEYCLLANESLDKYGLKTEKDVKEVVSDLKK